MKPDSPYRKLMITSGGRIRLAGMLNQRNVFFVWEEVEV